MKKNLRECQRVKVMAYQHQGPYKERDKIWHQNKDGKSWCGPSLVLYQKGRSVGIYPMGEIKKVAEYKVKPYKLMPRENIEERDEKNEKNTYENEVEMITYVQNDDLEEIENETREEIEKETIYF